jgi:putative N6-adenine-specific DNA methylase
MINQKSLERRIKRHIIAGKHTLFGAIQPGLEEAGERELSQLGLTPVREKEPGSLCTDISLDELWKTVLLTRSFSRLYLRLDSFKSSGFMELKQKLARIQWSLYLREGCSFKIKLTTRHCRLHVEDKIIKALNHCMQDHYVQWEGRPPVYTETKEKDAAIQTIIIRGVDDHFTISLDAGGGALYERGYRKFINDAPLKENIAAALLILSDLPENTLLLDAMSGSGTFALEGLGYSRGLLTAPNRNYPFEYWPSFRPGRFQWLKKEIIKEMKPGWQIAAADIDEKSIGAGRENLKLMASQCSVDPGACEFIKEDFFNKTALIDSGDRKPFLILNPPYGRRLSLEDQEAFFRKIGRQIMEKYKGIPWGIIVPGLECEKALGLKWEKKYLFKNGGYPVSYLLGVCR